MIDTDDPATMIRQIGAVGYGLAAYLFALLTVAYAVGFLADIYVPKTIDSGETGPILESIVVDLGLIGLFGLQHSLMARHWFKSWWTQYVPETIERSTYVLFATVALVVLMWGWRPLPTVVWQVDGLFASLLWLVYLSGWLLMFAAVYTIDGHRLLGLRQTWAYLRGRQLQPLDFQTPGLYRYVRHPIMTGFLIAFWVTPRMSLGHLVFALGMTGYIVVGVRLEERDLASSFGDRYGRYRRTVPMFVPRPWQRLIQSRPDGDRE